MPKKLKSYNVSVAAFATVLVIDAKNESEAMSLACDQLNFGDLQMDEASIKEEVHGAEELESSRRHADCVVEND